MGAFDPHLYRILLAEEINSMFTKREHSYFVADFIWSQDNVLQKHFFGFSSIEKLTLASGIHI